MPAAITTRKAPIDANNNGVLFLNSRISARDVTDGTSNTIYVGEKLAAPGDLGWMSGTRATLRNTGSPLDRPLGYHEAGGGCETGGDREARRGRRAGRSRPI